MKQIYKQEISIWTFILGPQTAARTQQDLFEAHCKIAQLEQVITDNGEVRNCLLRSACYIVTGSFLKIEKVLAFFDVHVCVLTL